MADAQRSGKAIPFFFVQLPAIVNESKSAAEWAKEIHETGGTIGYLLIAMHAAAALFHHYFVRDNTLRRMLPIDIETIAGPRLSATAPLVERHP